MKFGSVLRSEWKTWHVFSLVYNHSQTRTGEDESSGVKAEEEEEEELDPALVRQKVCTNQRDGRIWGFEWPPL